MSHGVRKDLYIVKTKKGWKIVHNTSNSYGYNTISCGNKMYMRHRIIAYAYLGLDIGDTSKEVDHINGNRIDNTVDNIRIVSHHENNHNRTTAKGYSWNKKANKWRSRIRLNNKIIHLGCYHSEEDARNAYLEAKKVYHPSAPHYEK